MVRPRPMALSAKTNGNPVKLYLTGKVAKGLILQTIGVPLRQISQGAQSLAAHSAGHPGLEPGPMERPDAKPCHGSRIALAHARLSGMTIRVGRSEEHTSELHSLMRISYAVFC